MTDFIIEGQKVTVEPGGTLRIGSYVLTQNIGCRMQVNGLNVYQDGLLIRVNGKTLMDAEGNITKPEEGEE